MAVVVSLNGVIVPVEEATLSVFDRGLLYGDSVYETVAPGSRNHAALTAHVERLAAAASAVGIELTWSHDGLQAAIAAVAMRCPDDAVIRVMVTRGQGGAGLDPTTCREPQLVIIAH